jgi:hypothetical protein
MAERDAAIDMLAGLLAEQRKTVAANKTNPIFRSPQTASSEKFLHDELRPLKEPMISTNLLGFDCGQLTRVRCWELSDGSQTIQIRHFGHERGASWNAVLGSILSSMPKGMP